MHKHLYEKGILLYKKRGKATSPAQLPNLILPICGSARPIGLPNLPQKFFREYRKNGRSFSENCLGKVRKPYGDAHCRK